MTAEDLWDRGEHAQALAHIARMIPHATDRRALKKVLRHTRLRPCVKGFCEIPALASLLEAKYIWAMLQRGGSMLASKNDRI